MEKKIIVGISGASGAIYGVRLLEALKGAGVQTYLILTDNAEKTIEFETGKSVREVKELATAVYDINDMAAPVSSGSFRTDGMVIAPCSIKTLSGIANSYDDNLLIRSADCILKERRRLIALVRETPLHLGHIELMEKVTKTGGIIMPPVPAFYSRPETVDDIVNQTVGKILDLLDIECGSFRRWNGIQER